MPYYYIALALAAGVLLVTWRMERSRLGHYLVAIGQNQDAAEALGIDSARAKARALMLSAFLMGLGASSMPSTPTSSIRTARSASA